MKIYHAQVNHLENPMGFRMERTVFSWKVKDAEGKKQSYARIRVASDAAMEHLLFDSGEENGFPVTVRRTVIHILKKKLFRQKR